VPHGYVVTVESESAARHGAPVLVRRDGTPMTIRYRLKYGDRELAFTNGRAVLTDSNTPALKPVAKELSIITQPAGKADPGLYSDTLHFTISYKN
jgi:hypothetical protein